MGEGWGEGQKGSISTTYLPLPLIPSHKGRGNGTFYEVIKNWVIIKSTQKNLTIPNMAAKMLP